VVKNKILILTAISIFALCPTVTNAHPGHGWDGGSFNILHYLTEPVHLLVLVGGFLVGLGIVWLVIWKQHRKKEPRQV
jgi:hypothetical protein